MIRLNRNRCQFCRFKKCLAVGMSRDCTYMFIVATKLKMKLLSNLYLLSCHHSSEFLRSETCPIVQSMHPCSVQPTLLLKAISYDRILCLAIFHCSQNYLNPSRDLSTKNHHHTSNVSSRDSNAGITETSTTGRYRKKRVFELPIKRKTVSKSLILIYEMK